MMGECGCGEINDIRDIVKIGENILVVEVYSGCRYCHSGVVVSLHLFTEEEAKCFQFESTKVFEPDEFGYGALHFPIVGQEDLAITCLEMESMENYIDVSDWLTDNGRELLQRAIAKRRQEK